jgi:hypothetical protein
LFSSLAQALGEPSGTDLAVLVLRDLPYGAALSHVRDGTRPPAKRRELLAAAIRAALATSIQPARMA